MSRTIVAKRPLRLLTALIVGVIAVSPVGPAAPKAALNDPVSAFERLAGAVGGKVEASFARSLGAFSFVRATTDRPLVRDDATASPESRARTFLAGNGGVIGMSADERSLVAGGRGIGSRLAVVKVERDRLGTTHVRFAQRYRGLEVYGGDVTVHLDSRGVTGVNGSFIPGITMSTTPGVGAQAASAIARNAMVKAYPGVAIATAKPALQLYRVGVLAGQPGRTALAYSVEASAPAIREKVVVDARLGAVLQRIPLIHAARDRVIYSPQYRRNYPDLFVMQREEGLQNPVPMVQNLYRFAGQVYDFFDKTFGRDSYDGKGATMRSVYLVNEVCPNAYWNGEATNYCPGFDLDDVVAHEWGHAYTEKTQGLVYFCQSGALNESYSDIWGETIDLMNGEDGIGGANNDDPYPAGQRWLVGEDLGQAVQEVLLRDMWDPERLGHPATATSDNYHCGADDVGGVHTNSGVPNLAYAMLVDGKKINGVDVRGIGFTKAAHIYYRAMTAYQTMLTQFPDHEQALKASCHDLIGKPINSVGTDQVSSERISVDDCLQVAKAATAVRFSAYPAQCAFQPLLAKGAPPRCPGAKTFFNEKWESGLGAWKLDDEGSGGFWPNLSWRSAATLPDGRTGRGAFAPDPNDGICPGTGNAGHFWMDSKEFVVPADALQTLRLRFDHWVATDPVDGGNVLLKVNDGEFTLIPTEAYLYNGPTGALGGNNPKAPEDGWAAADGGDVNGSWGTTVADLSTLAKPGDRLQLRFDFGIDCSGGVTGWYVDDIEVYDCPVLPAPAAPKISGGYSDPDPDGSLTLTWERPKDAVGPDLVQESRSSCAPLFTDDAESGLANWEATTEGDNPLVLGWDISSDKPEHDSNAFRARIPEPAGPASATLTLLRTITVPETGTTTLTFSDWFGSDRSDTGYVDVSDGGGAWIPVHTSTLGAGYPTLDYLTVALEERVVDLTRYAGHTIRLRFRYKVADVVSGYVDVAPVGWYVDDISIQNEDWNNVATVPGTSATISGLGGGPHCFRVLSSYRVRGALVRGLPSAAVGARVAGNVVARPATAPKPAPKPAPGLPATGVGHAPLAGALALLAALTLGAALRRRASRS
jgi:bacillolysin